MPLSVYNELYQGQREEIWKRQTPPKDYKATITTTWELAFQQVQKVSTEAIELLNICIFLAPDDIPISLFIDGTTCLPDTLADVVYNPAIFEDTIAALLQYSLIEREGEGLSIHRLVQDVAREQLGDKKSQKWIEIVVSILDKVFPFDKYELSTWQKSSRMLHHIEFTLGFAEKHGVALQGAANLSQKAGENLREQGEYNGAQENIKRALEIRQEIFGDNHPEVATSLDYLGEIYQEQATYAAALSSHEEALVIRKQVLGDNHPDTANSLNNLGGLYDSEGKYATARPLLQEALRVLEDVHGDHHPSLVKILVNLGQILVIQRQFVLARRYLTRARNICRNTDEQYSECLEVEAALKTLPGKIGRPQHKKITKKQKSKKKRR